MKLLLINRKIKMNKNTKLEQDRIGKWNRKMYYLREAELPTLQF